MPRRPKKKTGKHAPDHTFEVPLYGSTISVFLRDTPLDGAQAWCFEGAVPNSYGVVLQRDAGAGIIAHEAAHLSRWICSALALDPDPDNDEVFAYLLQFLTDQLSEICADPTDPLT